MVEAGDFAGVRVSQGEGSYEVRAKKVVFACGGFAQNEGMVGELAGGVAGECMPFCSAGSTGDAFALTESLGGVSVGKGAFAYWRDLFGLGALGRRERRPLPFPRLLLRWRWRALAFELH
ncbi:hypothetical protein [Rubneribacter badeniensis]|uniref:hypothetical protein n=1 Tax=Rubneribacter badeniensis TaxID=2070688 RepID=UPI003A94B520